MEKTYTEKEKKRQVFCQKMGILPGDIVLLSDTDTYDEEEKFIDKYAEEEVGGVDG